MSRVTSQPIKAPTRSFPPDSLKNLSSLLESDSPEAPATVAKWLNAEKATDLDLSATPLSEKSVICLAAALREKNGLTSLNLSNTSLSVNAFSCLAAALKGTTIETLVLQECALDDYHHEGISSLLGADSPLQNLDLAKNALAIGAARAVGRGLCRNVNLRSLDLSANQLDHRAYSEIMPAICLKNGQPPQNDTLRSLSFRGNCDGKMFRELFPFLDKKNATRNTEAQAAWKAAAEVGRPMHLNSLDLSNASLPINDPLIFPLVDYRHKLKYLGLVDNPAIKFAELRDQAYRAGTPPEGFVMDVGSSKKKLPAQAEVPTLSAGDLKNLFTLLESNDPHAPAAIAGLLKAGKLTELDLSATSLSESAVLCLASALRETGVTTLKLSKSPLSVDAFSQLAAVLQETSIDTLVLRECGLGDMHCQGLSLLLNPKSPLKKLDLGGNNLAQVAARVIGDALRVNKNLVELDLSENQLDHLAYSEIMPAICANNGKPAPNNTLRSLSLRRNCGGNMFRELFGHIEIKGATRSPDAHTAWLVAAQVGRPEHLTSLDLSDNWLRLDDPLVYPLIAYRHGMKRFAVAKNPVIDLHAFTTQVFDIGSPPQGGEFRLDYTKCIRIVPPEAGSVKARPIKVKTKEPTRPKDKGPGYSFNDKQSRITLDTKRQLSSLLSTIPQMPPSVISVDCSVHALSQNDVVKLAAALASAPKVEKLYLTLEGDYRAMFPSLAHLRLKCPGMTIVVNRRRVHPDKTDQHMLLAKEGKRVPNTSTYVTRIGRPARPRRDTKAAKPTALPLIAAAATTTVVNPAIAATTTHAATTVTTTTLATTTVTSTATAPLATQPRDSTQSQ